MNLQYRKLPDETRPEGYTFYPLLRIFLRYDVNMQYGLALVDSGATDCVFPASIAELLRINIHSGQAHDFHGFDLKLVKGYVHKVHLQVAGFTHWVSVDAVFLESEGMPILGQRGSSKAIRLSLKDGPDDLQSTLKKMRCSETGGDTDGTANRQTWI